MIVESSPRQPVSWFLHRTRYALTCSWDLVGKLEKQEDYEFSRVLNVIKHFLGWKTFRCRSPFFSKRQDPKRGDFSYRALHPEASTTTPFAGGGLDKSSEFAKTRSSFLV